ncbi:MAG: autotransporter domain-containing protein [Bradyrhizobium sp.]
MGALLKSVRGSGLLACVSFAGMVLASPGAFAQCTSSQVATPFTITNIDTLAVPTSAASASISSAIGSVNTAFLTQQGSAFVSAPANPSPDQPGGGVWARGVGGEVNTTSSSRSVGISTQGGAVINTATTNCNNSQRQTFAGAQVGTDIARLNWLGWNLHLGTTAGYLGAKSTDNFGFGNNFEVPFFGAYFVATKGRFFADLMVRQEFYNINLNNAAFAFSNQPVGAHGYSISASTGYNFDLSQGWFIEPSAGFIYSRTTVDSFTAPGVAGPNFTGITGVIKTNEVESQIGRLSLRVGKAIATPTMVWQPFASASVFHEFAGDVTSNYTSLNALLVGVPFSYSQTTSTSRVGTYGQYSLGIAGQIVNTGWLGFARVDYRNGNNLDGWTGNAGIRYQFSPEAIAAVMPTKVKAPAVLIAATNWTGVYAGGFFGGAAGRTDIAFPASPTATNRPWVFGPIGGLQVGYNYQFANNWVVGVEGDIAWADVHGGRSSGVEFNNAGFNSAYFGLQDKTSWMATATARVGYTMGRTLYYVKGGAAFEDSRVSATCFNPQGPLLGVPNLCTNQAGAVFANGTGFGTSSTRTGWTIGYGTEFDLGNNWSAKAEYDYISFGSHTALASDGTTTIRDWSDISQVKVGLNYRFGPTAVVAKY